MDSLYLFPPDDNTSMKTCKGPCGRTLPATIQFFRRGETCKDGLRGKCKKCETEQKKQRKDNPVKSDPVPATEGYKRCTGPCGQEYPATLEYFHRHQRANNGLHPQCKKCTNERIKKHREIPEVRKRYNDKKRNISLVLE